MVTSEIAPLMDMADGRLSRRINAFLQTWMSLTKGLSQAHSLLTARLVGAQIHLSPEGSRVFSMESHAMSDKLLINLFGLTISGHHHRACSSAAAAAMIRWCRPGLLKIGLWPWPKKSDTRWRNPAICSDAFAPNVTVLSC
jgi:hypothetical protein